MNLERRPFILRSSDDGRGSFEDEATQSRKRIEFATELGGAWVRAMLMVPEFWKNVKANLCKGLDGPISDRVLNFSKELFYAYLFQELVTRVSTKNEGQYPNKADDVRKKKRISSVDELAVRKQILLGGEVGERMDQILRSSAKNLAGSVSLD